MTMQLKSKYRIDADHARLAWAHINKAHTTLNDINEKKTYRSLVRSAGSDILTNGLGQTMAFYASKGVEEEKIVYHKAHGLLFCHIVDFLNQRGLIEKKENIVKCFFEQYCIDIPFNKYRLMIKETVGYISWARRFAESILPRD